MPVSSPKPPDRVMPSLPHALLANAASVPQVKGAVTVLKNRRRAAFIGSSGGVHDGNLLLALSACMFATLCSLGDKFFHLSGLPIGGVPSKVAANVAVGLHEKSRSLDVALRRSMGFAATAPAWDREVARGEER